MTAPRDQLDNDDLAEALARVTAMATATVEEAALIRESFGMWPVTWRSPAPRSADAMDTALEVWLGFDGARDDDAIVVIEKQSGVARIVPLEDR